MILLLISWLESVCHCPLLTVLSYTTTRLILACVTALGITLFFGPWSIKRLSSLRQPIRDLQNENGFLLGKLHKGKRNTPTMGGLLILVALCVSLFLWMDLSHPFTAILFLSTVALGLLGGMDDYRKLRLQNHKGVSAKKKLLVQCAVALFVASYLQLPAVTEAFHAVGLHIPDIQEFSSAPAADRSLSLQEYSSRLYIPCMKHPAIVFSGISLVLLWAFFSFVIVGCSNAVNLSDGLDGLAPGLVVFVAASLAVVAFCSNHQEIADYLNILYIEGSGEIAIFLAAVCGACLGFLWFNSHPAEIFMGDVGSLTLGGIVGIAAVLLRREFFLAIVGAIFVAEALSVILQVIGYRYCNKKRLFLCAPLHHHFEYMGWPETKVVIRFWIVAFVLALVGLLTLKLQ